MLTTMTYASRGEPDDLDAVVAIFRDAADPRPRAVARPRIDRRAVLHGNDPRDDVASADTIDSYLEQLVLRRRQQIDVALAGRQRAGTLELTNVEDQSGQSSLQRWPWQDSDTVDGHQRDEMRQAAASVNAGVPMSI
jgi:hypothetical protein